MTESPTEATAAEKVGNAAFYLGFFAGVACAAFLLYSEMKDIKRGLFDQLAGDSSITFSLIAAFLFPLGIGWLLRYMISGKRWS
ncbi:hypothetical protein AMST5_00191 [freshwater sediment metagenome]|jgi:hypothetical protein|uniref:Uncharacterized protein n=1 Tax=freshwater sediment metagenome TaxID=556182 RepID=A0AA48LYN8_9ZZZZ